MHLGRVLASGLFTLLLLGCATGEPAQRASWLERLYPFKGAAGADVVLMDFALIERPIGDPFINNELWLLVDEQAIPFERKAVLEENGFRVGQIGGTTPAGLQTLLTSEKTNGNGRRLFIHNGKPASLVLGPVRSNCSYRINQGSGPVQVSLDRAECTLSVLPDLSASGTIRLQFTPQINHGQTRFAPGIADDHSRFILKEQRPSETYHMLRFDMTLSRNQYILVGAYCDRDASLGYQCFVRNDEPAPVQRLLVIRACRAGDPPSVGSGDPKDDTVASSRIQPLASRAAFSPVAANSE
jgi:hypothetical protein